MILRVLVVALEGHGSGASLGVGYLQGNLRMSIVVFSIRQTIGSAFISVAVYNT